MQPITEGEILEFAPRAREDYVKALVNGWTEMERAGINTPARFVEAITVMAHETGGFTIVREATTWKPDQMCSIWPGRFYTRLDPRILACNGDPVKLANLAYSDRADIGNKGGNDGWDYRGGSFSQLTGRENFRRCGQAIGVPLEENPQFIENAEIGLKAFLWEWGKKGCNRFADRGYTRAVNNAINRGNAFSRHEPIGHDSRMKWKARAVAVFGEPNMHKEGLASGAYGVEVENLQSRLKELNYGVGAVDKVFGPALARAVVAFKHDQKAAGVADLEPDEVVGAKTWAAINTASPVVYTERQNATAKDLAAAGSEEIKAGQQQKAAGYLMLASGAAEGARQTGGLDIVQSELSWLPQLHTFMVPVVAAIKWGLENAFFVIPVVGGVWFFAKGRQVISARLKAHKLGFNLFR